MIEKIVRIFRKISDSDICRGSKSRAAWYTIDYLFCKLRYRLMLEEYIQYNFHRLTGLARREYITEYHVMKLLPQKFNKGNDVSVLNNKVLFNKHFEDLLGRAYCYIDENGEADFVSFMTRYKEAILKPVDASCGHGVVKICSENRDLHEWYQELRAVNGKFLLEEIFIQHDDIGKLNSDTVNTIRAISMINSEGEVNVPFCSIRIGRVGAVVDNFCAGGMTAAIDIHTGIIISCACDSKSMEYLIHPDTGCQIVGHRIPNWDMVLETVKKAALRVPSARFVGWDVVIHRNGNICLIEGNARPGARTIQMPLNRGVRPEYEKYLGSF